MDNRLYQAITQRNHDLLQYTVKRKACAKNMHSIYVLLCSLCLGTNYNDVIKSAMASQITGAPTVCSAFCSGAEHRKHQISASLAFVRAIHRWPLDSPHKGPVTRKKVSFWWRHHTNVLVATLENMSKCVIWTNKKPLIWPQYKENKTKQWKYFAVHTVFKDIIQIYLHLQVSHLGWNSQWINYRAYKIDRPTWQMYWLADTSVCVALCSIIWEARTGPVLCNKITHWFTSRINTVSPALSDFRERWFSQGEALKVVKCI